MINHSGSSISPQNSSGYCKYLDVRDAGYLMGILVVMQADLAVAGPGGYVITASSCPCTACKFPVRVPAAVSRADESILDLQHIFSRRIAWPFIDN